MKTIHHNYSSLGLSASQSCGFVSAHKHNTADISVLIRPTPSTSPTKCILSYIISCISPRIHNTYTDGLYNIHFVYLWNIQMICLLWHTYSKCIATLAKKTRNKWHLLCESVYRMYRNGQVIERSRVVWRKVPRILFLTVNWFNFSHV